MHVADLGQARDFYERLFGRPPDLVPNEREVAWHLHEGAWIVLIADGEAAGRALNTLILAELDPFLAAASEAGIEPGPVEPVGDGMRQSIIEDPDGNRLKVAAPVSGV
ncbi:MAG TPA: VOC family protein [Solirubrobacteraceae bacterium]|nr:VOC family protein [Solirubrobacteraceae bacterium]